MWLRRLSPAAGAFSLSLMTRYITFLDILGFGEMVKSKSLAEMQRLLGLALQSIQIAKWGGVHQGVPSLNEKPPLVFSFSDTFVLASRDLSEPAVASYVVTSALLTQYLFAQTLPVRGTMTFGEADFIPGTNHMVGKGIVHAAELEKQQNWFGVLVDLPRMPAGAQQLFELPQLAPLFVRWNLPLKGGNVIENALVVNWRNNLTVEGGTKSLFAKPPDKSAAEKIEHTLAFAKHMRDTGRHTCNADDGKGGKLSWLLGCRTTASGSSWDVPHGDEY